MRDMKHDLIDRQLNIYEDEAENDYEDMIEFYNHQILHDMSDPYDVFHALLRSVESSRAYDFFLSLLQHMLLIREEGDLRYCVCHNFSSTWSIEDLKLTMAILCLGFIWTTLSGSDTSS